VREKCKRCVPIAPMAFCGKYSVLIPLILSAISRRESYSFLQGRD
jgi:hypothetical protein